MKTSRNKEIKLEEKKGAFSAWESVAGLKRTCDDDMKTEYSTSDIQKISNTKKRKRNEEEFSTNSKLEDEQKIHYPSEYSHSVANKSEDDGPVNASISEDEEESFTVKKAFDHIISPHSEGFTNIDYEDISDKLGIDKLFELVIKLLQKDADNEDNNNFNHIRKLTSNSEEWMDIDIINEEFYMLCSINLKHAVENDNEEAVEFFVELGADKKAGRRVYKPTNSQKIANILDIDGDMSDVEEELSEKNQSEQEEKSEEENDTEEDLTVNYVLKWIRNEQELDENGEILDHEEYPALDDDAYQEIIEKLDSIELVEVIETLIKEDKEGNYLADIKILLSCSHVEIDSDLLDVALVRAINDNEEGTAIFFIKHGAAGSDTAISEAIKHDSYEILSHLEVEADKKHVRAAAEGSYCSAVTYFLEHDFETSSELILIVAAEKSDEELVKIVCDHARLDQAYEIIECLIDNNGKALVSICIENFGTEDLLTTLRDDDIKGKVYGCVLELARSSLISRGILDEEIDLVLSSFDEKLKLSTTLLSYHVNDFKGNLKLLEWRKKIDSSKGLSDKKRQAANLLGFCLSTARSNLVDSPYHPLERKELEKYPRGAGQPYRRWLRLQAARKNKMTYEGKSIPGSSAAHYGFTANFHDYDVSEDVVALDTTSQPSGNIGTGDLYDNTLLYRRKLCDYISNHFSKESETAIKVGFYHNYPCLMIFINQSERAKNLTQHFGAKLLSALTGWTQIVVSYFVGLVNATAQQHGLDIELVRRSSFGFLTPTISDCGQSFRLSVGIIPIEYANILIDCLKILNETLTILSKENKTLESCKLNTTLPKDCFIYNKSYPDYMGDDKEVKAANILDLIWIVIERGAQGKTGAFSLTRTFVGRDGLTAEVYREINKYKPTSLHEYAEILLNALRWGFSHFQLAKRNNKLALRFNEKIPINFKAVLGKHAVINDHSFFEYIKSILTAVRHEQSLNATRYDLFPSTYALNTLKEDEDETVRAIEISIKQRTITGIYFNLEMLNELLYVRNILTCSGNVEDGFGSDSEVEEEIEEKSHFIYAKKNIVRNGMRSISATLEASLDFLRNKLKNRKPKCYLHGAYYETSKAIKLLNKLKKNQLQVTKNVSEADILLYDINACITEGIPLENIDHQIDHIKIIIIDSTSAITEEQNAWVRKFQRSSQMQILFFVSSGLKNEQIGADKNHYGTSRVVTKDKEILNGIVRFIRASKAANIRSAISHGHRRMNIRFGNVPRNGTIVKLKGHQLAGKEEKCPVTLISDVSYNSSIKFSTSTSSTGDSLMMSDAFSSLDSGSLSSSTKILFPSPSAVLSMGTAQPNKSQSVDEKSDIDTFSYAEPLDGMLSKPAAYLEKPAIVIPHFAKSTHIDFKTERNPASMFGTSAKSPKDRSSFLPSPNLMKDKALGSDKDTQTKKRDINSLAMKHFKGQEEGKDSKDLRRFDSWYSDRAIQEIISSKQSQLVLRCVFLPLHSIELPQAEEEKDSIEEDLIENITKNAETLSNPKNVPQKAGKDDVSKKLKDDFTIDKTAFDQSKSDDWGKIEEQDDFDIIMKDCEAIEATKKENETKDLKVSQSFEKQFQCMQILKNHIQASHACFVSFEPDQMGSNKHFIFGLYVNSYLLIIDPMGKNPRWDFLEKLAIVKKNHNIEKVFFSTTKLQDDPNGDVSCGPICTELLLHLSQSNKEYIYTTLKFLSTQKSEKSLEDKESTCFAIDLSDTKLLPETLKQLKGAKGKEEYMSLMSNIRQSHLAHIQNGSADDESNGYEQYVFSYMIQDRINLISLDEDSRCQELVKRFKQKLRTIISPPDVAQQIAQQRSYVRPVRHATMSSRDGGLAEEKKAKQMPTSRGS